MEPAKEKTPVVGGPGRGASSPPTGRGSERSCSMTLQPLREHGRSAHQVSELSAPCWTAQLSGKPLHWTSCSFRAQSAALAIAATLRGNADSHNQRPKRRWRLAGGGYTLGASALRASSE